MDGETGSGGIGLATALASCAARIASAKTLSSRDACALEWWLSHPASWTSISDGVCWAPLAIRSVRLVLRSVRPLNVADGASAKGPGTSHYPSVLGPVALRSGVLRFLAEALPHFGQREFGELASVIGELERGKGTPPPERALGVVRDWLDREARLPVFESASAAAKALATLDQWSSAHVHAERFGAAELLIQGTLGALPPAKAESVKTGKGARRGAPAGAKPPFHRSLLAGLPRAIEVHRVMPEETAAEPAGGVRKRLQEHVGRVVEEAPQSAANLASLLWVAGCGLTVTSEEGGISRVSHRIDGLWPHDVGAQRDSLVQAAVIEALSEALHRGIADRGAIGDTLVGAVVACAQATSGGGGSLIDAERRFAAVELGVRSLHLAGMSQRVLAALSSMEECPARSHAVALIVLLTEQALPPRIADLAARDEGHSWAVMRAAARALQLHAPLQLAQIHGVAALDEARALEILGTGPAVTLALGRVRDWVAFAANPAAEPAPPPTPLFDLSDLGARDPALEALRVWGIEAIRTSHAIARARLLMSGNDWRARRMGVSLLTLVEWMLERLGEIAETRATNSSYRNAFIAALARTLEETPDVAGSLVELERSDYPINLHPLLQDRVLELVRGPVTDPKKVGDLVDIVLERVVVGGWANSTPAQSVIRWDRTVRFLDDLMAHGCDGRVIERMVERVAHVNTHRLLPALHELMGTVGSGARGPTVQALRDLAATLASGADGARCTDDSTPYVRAKENALNGLAELACLAGGSWSDLVAEAGGRKRLAGYVKEMEEQVRKLPERERSREIVGLWRILPRADQIIGRLAHEAGLPMDSLSARVVVLKECLRELDDPATGLIEIARAALYQPLVDAFNQTVSDLRARIQERCDWLTTVRDLLAENDESSVKDLHMRLGEDPRPWVEGEHSVLMVPESIASEERARLREVLGRWMLGRFMLDEVAAADASRWLEPSRALFAVVRRPWLVGLIVVSPFLASWLAGASLAPGQVAAVTGWAFSVQLAVFALLAAVAVLWVSLDWLFRVAGRLFRATDGAARVTRVTPFVRMVAPRILGAMLVVVAGLFLSDELWTLLLCASPLGVLAAVAIGGSLTWRYMQGEVASRVVAPMDGRSSGGWSGRDGMSQVNRRTRILFGVTMAESYIVALVFQLFAGRVMTGESQADLAKLEQAGLAGSDVLGLPFEVQLRLPDAFAGVVSTALYPHVLLAWTALALFATVVVHLYLSRASLHEG